MQPTSDLSTSPQTPAPTAPVLCIGETMVMLSAENGSLHDSVLARLHVGGAESNVATGLAHLGHDVEWFGRLGDDPFGQRIRSSHSARGIRIDNLIIDDQHRTGVYFKDWENGQSAVYYYRADSAAAHMSSDDFDRLHIEKRRLCHTSGITPALSTLCSSAMHELFTERDRGDASISFDVNYRSRLWSVSEAAPRILELARAADIVFVGRDEAAVLWDTATPESIRALLPDVAVLVVKDSDIGATSFARDSSVFVPALSVEVVEPIGAGDAFAAGFLAAWLSDQDHAHCLRWGHVMAAQVLRSIDDTPVLPPKAQLAELASLDDRAWNDLHLAAPPLSEPTSTDKPTITAATFTEGL